MDADVPEVEEGSYTLTATPVGAESGFETTIQVVQNNPIFIETDKPIYKPGQTVHVRLLCLNNNLVPVVQNTTVEISDGKGVKVFKLCGGVDICRGNNARYTHIQVDIVLTSH